MNFQDLYHDLTTIIVPGILIRERIIEAIEAFKKDPKVNEALLKRKEARRKYAEIFKVENLEKMTKDDFSSFLKMEGGNEHWTQLPRHKMEILDDMRALKKAISHLQDEEVKVEDRLHDVIQNKDSDFFIKGIGRAIATGIVYIVDDKDKYGVWNSTTEGTLKELELIPKELTYQTPIKKAYPIVNESLNSLKNFGLSNPNEVDYFMWWFKNNRGKIMMKEAGLDLAVKNAIREIHEDIEPERIKKRGEFEKQAIKLIENNVGNLNKSQIGQILNYLDSDYSEGETSRGRFGTLISGSNIGRILRNDSKDLNSLFLEIFKNESLSKADFFVDELEGVGDGLISAILYLKNAEKYNVKLGRTESGLRNIFPDSQFEGSFSERYKVFNNLANKVKSELSLKPQEMDIVLSVLGRPRIFLCPDAEGNINISVVNGFERQRLLNKNLPEYCGDRVWMWGVKPNNKGAWEDVSYGNYLLFYPTGQADPKKYTYMARVLGKMQNKPLSEEVWMIDPTDNKSRELIIFLQRPKKIDCSSKEFSKRAGYSEKFVPQGFMKVNIRAQKRINLLEWLEDMGVPSQENKMEVKKLIDPKKKERLENAERLLEHKKQIILYGPPGTSKTFFAKQLAIWIMDKEVVEEEQMVNKRCKELQEKLSVDLVQFHPAYSYEDFIEGIRPEVTDDDRVKYEVRPGIFKMICEQAKSASGINYYAKVGGYKLLDSPQKIMELQRNSINRIDFSRFLEIIGEPELPEYFPKKDELVGYYVLRSKRDSPYTDVDEKQYHFRPGIAGSTQLKEDFEKGKVGFVYYDRDRGGAFGCGFFDRLDEQKGPENLVFIIDEINRGDIAKIFGELIYGLEYRDEPVKLQYSGLSFVIPKNVFIVGTMNTADVSIALIDVALRRRFSFIQCMPDYDFLTRFFRLGEKFDEEGLRQKYGEMGETEKIKTLSVLTMKTLNDEIAKRERIGRDKQIGHTYLMRLTEDTGRNFVVVWKNDVLPLLEEYFFYNYDELVGLFKEGEKIIDKNNGIRDFNAKELKEVLEKTCDLWSR